MRHQYLLNECFKLAGKGKGLVSPNPLVGAVLVKNGKVIGKGYHRKYGTDHAEVNAIKNSKVDVAGSTLYCNLEPCCHTNKQTPPCVPLIIQKRINRVVISNLDPNPDVNGKGIQQLKKAGIEVITSVLENEGKELNKFYFKYITEKLPYITLKVAQSKDGKIAISNKKQTWLTGKASKKYVHQLRTEYDAVLVGAGTIKSDNPLLTVREVKGRNPIRIIIDGKLSSSINSKIFNSKQPEKTWVITSSKSDVQKRKNLEAMGIRIISVTPSQNGKLGIKKILKVLAENKISSVLVEGGAEIFNKFQKNKLYDEIIILQSPIILGKGINDISPDSVKCLQLLSLSRLGKDIRRIYRKKLSD
jgi:diaminohydroxyphosphoribosylaminopyrimidine deaminase / 5-amino-6-(5-phosphoribosylamino)uracil reductase